MSKKWTLPRPQSYLLLKTGLPRWLSGKESACQCRRYRKRRFSPWVQKIPWRRKWQPTLVFLPGKSHGQRKESGGLQFKGSKWVGHRWTHREQKGIASQISGTSNLYSVSHPKLNPCIWQSINHENNPIESQSHNFQVVKNSIWPKTPVKMSKALIPMIA